ncbi:3382_t:CDS:2, partial [Acaulospora morrowiae]
MAVNVIESFLLLVDRAANGQDSLASNLIIDGCKFFETLWYHCEQDRIEFAQEISEENLSITRIHCDFIRSVVTSYSYAANFIKKFVRLEATLDVEHLYYEALESEPENGDKFRHVSSVLEAPPYLL